MRGQLEAVSNEELHAYVDGALEPAQLARVEAYLASHPQEAERARAYSRLNEGLRALGASLEQTAPAASFHPKRRKIRHFAANWQILRALPWAAAVAGLLIVGAAGGWWAHGQVDDDSKPELYQLSAVAYQLYTPQQRHPVEVWANDRDHLQAWLTTCLKAPIIAPELAQAGYTLLGGRLLSNVQGAAALLIYQGKDNQRVGLYIANAADWGPGKPAFEEVGKLGTFTWTKGPFWYSLTGNLKADELKTMARAVNQQVVSASAT